MQGAGARSPGTRVLRARLRPDAARLVDALRRIIQRKNKLLEKVKTKLKTLKKKRSKLKTSQDASSQTDSVASTEAPGNAEKSGWDVAAGEDTASKKSIAEQVKEVAQSAMMQTGMVYVESAGMYYDYKSGYYYNSELGLYYHSSTGCYYYYSEDKNEFTYHSHADTSRQASTHAHAGAAQTPIQPQTEQLLRKKQNLKKHKKENEDAEKIDGPKEAKRRKHSKTKKDTKDKKSKKIKKLRVLNNCQVDNNEIVDLCSSNGHKKESYLSETINTKDKCNKVGVKVDENNMQVKAITKEGNKPVTNMDDNIEANDSTDVAMNDDIESKCDIIDIIPELKSGKDPEAAKSNEVSNDKIDGKDTTSGVNGHNDETKYNTNTVRRDKVDIQDDKIAVNEIEIDSKERRTTAVKGDKVENEEKSTVNYDKIEAKCDDSTVKDDSYDEMEDGECSDTCSEAGSDSDGTTSGSTVTDIEDAVVRHHPPGMRIIVRETNLPKLKVGSLFLVTKDGGTLGREGEDHAVLISDENVSRIHLQFIYNEKRGSYDAIDLGSKNGTLLNGTRMSKSQEVSPATEIVHGSTIQVGETKLLCHIHPGSDTCGHCEPGLIMAEEDKSRRQAYTRTCGLKQQHALELARLKNRYAPEPLAIEEGDYNDRAKARREKVGSTHDAEKTQQSDLSTTIAEDNKGFQMLAKMGWSKGEGLGKELQGEKEPVPLVSNEGTAGLGAGGVGAPAAPAAPAARPAMRLAARPRPRLRPAARAFRDPLEEDD